MEIFKRCLWSTVTDIGRYILEPQRKINPYKYSWALLDTLRRTIGTNGVDDAIKLYLQFKESKSTSFIFNENQLNYLGNELRKNKKIKEAIKIYELNLKEYPESPIVYESLGETYRRNKNEKISVKYFEKAFELDPQNPHWTYILKKIKTDERKKNNR